MRHKVLIYILQYSLTVIKNEVLSKFLITPTNVFIFTFKFCFILRLIFCNEIFNYLSTTLFNIITKLLGHFKMETCSFSVNDLQGRLFRCPSPIALGFRYVIEDPKIWDTCFIILACFHIWGSKHPSKLRRWNTKDSLKSTQRLLSNLI